MKRNFLKRKGKVKGWMLFSLFFFSATFLSHAQINVRGKIVNVKDKTRIGVNVVIKRTSQDTVKKIVSPSNSIVVFTKVIKRVITNSTK